MKIYIKINIIFLIYILSTASLHANVFYNNDISKIDILLGTWAINYYRNGEEINKTLEINYIYNSPTAGFTGTKSKITDSSIQFGIAKILLPQGFCMYDPNYSEPYWCLANGEDILTFSIAGDNLLGTICTGFSVSFSQTCAPSDYGGIGSLSAFETYEENITGYRLNPANDNIEKSIKLFEWAEQNYPEYFPSASGKDVDVEGYIARYYSETDTYIGTQGEKVYVYGKIFGGLVHVGVISDYIKIE